MELVAITIQIVHVGELTDAVMNEAGDRNLDRVSPTEPHRAQPTGVGEQGGHEEDCVVAHVPVGKAGRRYRIVPALLERDTGQMPSAAGGRLPQIENRVSCGVAVDDGDLLPRLIAADGEVAVGRGSELGEFEGGEVGQEAGVVGIGAGRDDDDRFGIGSIGERENLLTGKAIPPDWLWCSTLDRDEVRLVGLIAVVVDGHENLAKLGED